MGNSSSSSSSENLYKLPNRYKIINVLGKGGFGEVVKCWDRETKKFVAIKMAIGTDLSEEASILKVLMDNNLDQQGIVKFYSGFWMNKCLIFEALDISLREYLHQRNAPLCLRDVRAVIQQLATAFDALKKIGIIHTDVKTNNIMVVDHQKQPLKVKLIDFGLAIHRSSAKYTKLRQTPLYRAPEVMLDLPFSEAIDIWSLSGVMAKMVFGFGLFVGNTNYELLQHIIDLIGPPPNRLINAGQRSRLYFQKTDSNQWVLKTPDEYWGEARCVIDNRRYTFRCLDEAKTMHLEKNNRSEAEERKACIELLKAMLKWDEKKRITPSKILAHPFITMNYISSSTDLSSSNNTALGSAKTESSSSQTSEASMSQGNEVCTDYTTGPSINQGAEPGTHKDTEPQLKSPQSRNPHVLVQPAPPQNRILLEETSDEEYIIESDLLASASEDSTPAAAPANILREASGPGTNKVAGSSINLAAEHDTENVERPSFNQVAEPDTNKAAGYSINRAAEPVSIKSPQSGNPGLILVWPAPPQNRILLEETSDEEYITENDSLASTSEDSTPAAAPANIIRSSNKLDYTEDSEPKRKKKKKENAIISFFSWLKRTVCSGCNVDEVAE